ncbi:MAG: efflux RND transporter periplasmic adaptor subunit [Bryobacteraceae bacterium]
MFFSKNGAPAAAPSNRAGTGAFASLLLPAATVLVLLAPSCGARHEPASRTESEPIAVTTRAVQPAQWPDQFEATGSVAARQSAAISARLMGYIREVRVREGDSVAPGQTLAVIDSRELATSLAQANAALAAARSGTGEADSAIAQAQANLNLATTTARRMEELLGKRSVSQQEYDEAAARVKVAESQVSMAKARRAQLDDNIRQAAQGVESANIMQSYATIQAPFAGRVTKRLADPGALASPGMPILEIEQAGGYRLEAAVEESRLSAIRRGQPVAVRLEAVGRPLTGRVGEIVPAVDAASRSFLVKIDLPAGGDLRSGLFGRAVFSLGERQVVAVPREAVITQGQVTSVFVAESNLARRRLVQLGATHEGDVEILAGLSAGDHVIHPRPPGLEDGSPVRERAPVQERAE